MVQTCNFAQTCTCIHGTKCQETIMIKEQWKEKIGKTSFGQSRTKPVALIAFLAKLFGFCSPRAPQTMLDDLFWMKKLRTVSMSIKNKINIVLGGRGGTPGISFEGCSLFFEYWRFDVKVSLVLSAIVFV